MNETDDEIIELKPLKFKLNLTMSMKKYFLNKKCKNK